MLLKIVFKEEIHLMRFNVDKKFEDFSSKIVSSFKKLPKNYHLVYTDEDGDSINLDTQQDLDNLLELGLAKVNIRIIDLDNSSQN